MAKDQAPTARDNNANAFRLSRQRSQHLGAADRRQARNEPQFGRTPSSMPGDESR